MLHLLLITDVVAMMLFNEAFLRYLAYFTGIISLILASKCWAATKVPRTDETRLIDSIMEDYNPAARPVYNASRTVTVKFGITLTQISDMDEVNQVLTINVWLEQEWVDERLTWDPKDYNNLHVLRIPCEKLWLPDIVLYNSADDFTTGYMNSKAMVRHNGSVFWPPPAKFRSSCKIDITYFPFDDQTCELKFGSWTYDGFQVDITNRSSEVDLQNFVFSGEWELMRVGIRRTEETYGCCIEPYPDVRFTIVIRRKTLYYLFNIIFPCLWLTILSLLGFWLPPDSGEKITLGITVLLAFSVFMLLIAESMPATSEFVPLIGIYLTVTMGMTSLSIILTVFVLQLHHVGPHKKRVPPWLRTIVFDVLARLVCMGYASKAFRNHRLTSSRGQHKIGTRDATAHFSYAYRAADSSAGHHPNVCSNSQNRVESLMGNGLVSKSQMWSVSSTPPLIQQVNCIASGRNENETIAVTEGTRRSSSKKKNLDRSGVHGSRTLSTTTTTPVPCRQSQFASSESSFRHGSPHDNHSVRYWTDMATARKGHNFGVASSTRWHEDHLWEVGTEWQFVAHVMDRALFWLFLIVATMSSIAILVIKPLMKPDL